MSLETLFTLIIIPLGGGAYAHLLNRINKLEKKLESQQDELNLTESVLNNVVLIVFDSDISREIKNQIKNQLKELEAYKLKLNK